MLTARSCRSLHTRPKRTMWQSLQSTQCVTWGEEGVVGTGFEDGVASGKMWAIQGGRRGEGVGVARGAVTEAGVGVTKQVQMRNLEAAGEVQRRVGDFVLGPGPNPRSGERDVGDRGCIRRSQC